MAPLAPRKASICCKFNVSASCTRLVNPQHDIPFRLILYWIRLILAFRPITGYYVYSKGNALPTTLLLPGCLFMNGDLNFHIGDKVVYPNHGVGVIEQISSRSIGATVEKFYLLNIKASSLKVMVPCNNVGSVGIRRVVRNRS